MVLSANGRPVVGSLIVTGNAPVFMATVGTVVRNVSEKLRRKPS
jgi:hypothetical protein